MDVICLYMLINIYWLAFKSQHSQWWPKLFSFWFPISALEWDYVVPFGPIRVTFSSKCFPVQPLKVNDSVSIEIWNLLSILIGVTLDFYWFSYAFVYVRVQV